MRRTIVQNKEYVLVLGVAALDFVGKPSELTFRSGVGHHVEIMSHS